MQIPGGLQQATLIRRYKRFLADISLSGAGDSARGGNDDDRRLTLHCPNTGSMKNCADPGSRIWFSTSSNPARKYPHTWEVVEVQGRWLAGINTGRANRLVEEALQRGIIRELSAYPQIRSEVRYGKGSRIDFLLEGDGPPCYVEVKSVTLITDDNGLGIFPDAVTLRGQKHLRELIKVATTGHRAVLMFCVQHTGIKQVAPADNIDPEYSNLLRQAVKQGVEVLAYRANFDLNKAEITLQDTVPVVL